MAEADPAAPLCVTFRMTIDDYRGGVRRLAWALWPIRLIVLVMIAAAIAGLMGVLLPNPILAIVGLVVFVIYALVLASILYIRPGQAFRRRADLRGDQTYCFSDSDVSMTFVSGDSRVKWSYFVGLLETKDLYLLCHPMRQLGSIIPKRAFADPASESAFRRFAQRIGKGSQPTA